MRVSSDFEFRDRVYIDGDRSLVACVTGFIVREGAAPLCGTRPMGLLTYRHRPEGQKGTAPLYAPTTAMTGRSRWPTRRNYYCRFCATTTLLVEVGWIANGDSKIERFEDWRLERQL